MISMKICKDCCYPVEQCQCTPQEKSYHQWKRQAALEEWLESCDVKIRSLQDDLEIFRTYPEEKAAIIQEYEKEKSALDYHQENSFEIDEDFAEVIPMFWKKGYDTRFCCSGHPDKEQYSLYITFAQDYEFDFTDLPLKNGWEYHRRNEYGEPCYSLYYTMPPSVKKKLQKENRDIEAYFLEQRNLLMQWVQSLPPAKIADYHQKLRGHRKKSACRKEGKPK